MSVITPVGQESNLPELPRLQLTSSYQSQFESQITISSETLSALAAAGAAFGTTTESMIGDLAERRKVKEMFHLLLNSSDEAMIGIIEQGNLKKAHAGLPLADQQALLETLSEFKNHGKLHYYLNEVGKSPENFISNGFKSLAKVDQTERREIIKGLLENPFKGSFSSRKLSEGRVEAAARKDSSSRQIEEIDNLPNTISGLISEDLHLFDDFTFNIDYLTSKDLKHEINKLGSNSTAVKEALGQLNPKKSPIFLHELSELLDKGTLSKLLQGLAFQTREQGSVSRKISRDPAAVREWITGVGTRKRSSQRDIIETFAKDPSLFDRYAERSAPGRDAMLKSIEMRVPLDDLDKVFSRGGGRGKAIQRVIAVFTDALKKLFNS